WRRRDGDASTARTCCRSSAPASLSWTASSRRARSTGRKRKRRDHATSTSITYLAIDHRLPQVLQQRPRVLQVARVEAFGEPGVERGEERAGRVTLALALPEPRQAGGRAQLERLGLLPPGDLQGVAEERLRLLDRIPVHVEENLCSQPVELGIVVVLSLLLGARDAESENAQGV